MFSKTAPVVEPAPVMDPPERLVPLVELELSLAAPVEGWATHLADRGIAIVLDDLGRSAVARDAARRLFDEHRELEVRRVEMAAEMERRAVEADQAWRSQLPHGLPWWEIPDGVLPVVAMTQADRDAQPKRMTPLQEALSGESLTYHSLHPAPDDE